MTWALRDIPGVEDLLAYEARVNQVMAGNPEAAAISLCLYDVERFDAELIVGVLRTHPKAVIAGTVIDNPFYIQPEEFLRQRLCWRIHTGDSSARSRVRREAQVPPGGMPLSQASTRTRLSASAVSTCSRWVLASPR